MLWLRELVPAPTLGTPPGIGDVDCGELNPLEPKVRLGSTTTPACDPKGVGCISGAGYMLVGESVGGVVIGGGYGLDKRGEGVGVTPSPDDPELTPLLDGVPSVRAL
jgi:hypothetical protein